MTDSDYIYNVFDYGTFDSHPVYRSGVYLILGYILLPACIILTFLESIYHLDESKDVKRMYFYKALDSFANGGCMIPPFSTGNYAHAFAEVWAQDNL